MLGFHPKPHWGKPFFEKKGYPPSRLSARSVLLPSAEVSTGHPHPLPKKLVLLIRKVSSEK